MTAIDPSWQKPETTPVDFIIVGAGAGGAPLATRLAERGFQVLVVEMGPGNQPATPQDAAVDATEVPLLHPETVEDKRHSLRYFVDHFGGENEERNPRRQTNDSRPVKNPGDEVGVFYPRAQGIGGCTIHNAMITICGPSDDWDLLAKQLKDLSWRGDQMRAYFQRLEKCHYNKSKWWVDLFRFVTFRTSMGWGNGRHGDQGWLDTTMSDLRLLKKDKKFLKVVTDATIASINAGIDSLAELSSGPLPELDPNHWETMRRSQEGITRIPCAITPQGRRSSPRDRFRDVQEEHDNLLSLTDCLVTSLVFDETYAKAPFDKGHKVHGIELLEHPHVYEADAQAQSPARDWKKKLQNVYCKREVILCAGSFNTPQLLMLSGIGPTEEKIIRRKKTKVIRNTKIPARKSLENVGLCLQDRYEVPVIGTLCDRFRMLDPIELSSQHQDPVLQEWIANKVSPSPTNVYSTNGGLIGIFKKSKQEKKIPDLFMFALAGYFEGYKEGWSRPETLAPAQDGGGTTASGAAKEKRTISWLALKARSRNKTGKVELRDESPFRRPKIDFNILPDGPDGENQDLDALVEGVEFILEIIKSGLQSGFLESFEFPGASSPIDLDLASDERRARIRTWIKDVAWGHHACGTCRMGLSEEDSVINNRFQVHDVSGLRVVDASVFRDIPGYFIVTNIYMVAEKAADVIAEDHPDHFQQPAILGDEKIQNALRRNPIHYSDAESLARSIYPVEMEHHEARLIRERRAARHGR